MKTRRERIIELLIQTEYPITAKEICDILEIKSQSLVYEDLGHIAKSVKARKQDLVMRPAQCAKCDYLFKARESAKRPSRCPKCKSEWLIAPAFMIRDKKK